MKIAVYKSTSPATTCATCLHASSDPQLPDTENSGESGD
jgi:hypothetical protein